MGIGGGGQRSEARSEPGFLGALAPWPLASGLSSLSNMLNLLHRRDECRDEPGVFFRGAF